jgi:hypothetical protein
LSPWRLPGRLKEDEEAALRRAGALIEVVGPGFQTVVTWPGTTLRDFMLFDVLMHEVGHHIAQHETGKHYGRVYRTRDHEAIAARFAQQCRQRHQGDAWLAR